LFGLLILRYFYLLTIVGYKARMSAEQHKVVETVTNIAPKDLSHTPTLRSALRHDGFAAPRDGAFDTVCDLVQRFLSCHAVVVNIVDREGLFGETHGGDRTREPGLCISSALNDASLDPRTLSNPLVATKLGLSFYVGVPLRTGKGHHLGMLVALDKAPRELEDSDVESLKLFARLVVETLELRLAARPQS
jgi:eukaryotic-like serine/threonine-protein kinase